MKGKQFVSAQQLLDDSRRLALQLHHAGQVPDLLVGVWRGGAPVAVAMHEVFLYLGYSVANTVVKTFSYTGIQARADQVVIRGQEELREYALQTGTHRILFVDDVFDTGRTMEALLSEVRALAPVAELQIAVPWFKPQNNETDLVPDHYLHSTEQWIVFPHELCGLSAEEIQTHFPDLDSLLGE